MRPGRAVRAAAAATLAALLAACGYHFPGEASSLPGGGRRVVVTRFENRTQTPGVENEVMEAILLEFARRGQFQVVRDQADADLVLEGSVSSLETRPVAFSRNDETLQYETIMTISASLRDPRSNSIVWRISSLRETDSYGAVSQTVVASSSAFLSQSNLNANDLNQLTDVQLSESQRREALERVTENVSRDLYNAIVEDF
ncbi:MAG: LPS assembly lipoprotein LptE [Alphaproteobacteria bacterium]